ncbi:hypothetical protein, partial [Pseudomonas fluorescens]
MPKHKNKAPAPTPDSAPTLIARYLFPVTLGVLLMAVAGIGWFLFSSQPAPTAVVRTPAAAPVKPQPVARAPAK